MFLLVTEAVLARAADGGGPAYFHFQLWHVAIIVGMLLCVLLLAGLYILDLRKALREREREAVRMRRELASREWAADSLQGSLGDLARELSAMADEFVTIDPRLKAAAIVLARRGRELETALAIVRKVQEHNRAEAARLAEGKRLLEETGRRNVESASALSAAHAALRGREKVLSGEAERLKAAAEVNAKNAASLVESTDRNEETLRTLETAVDSAKASGLLPPDEEDPDKTLLN